MPRTPQIPKDRVLTAVAATKTRGATSADVAQALDIPERTARRLLAALFTAREVTRTGEYAGEPPVFHYRYNAKKK